ncbi:MAG: hypothetical protein CMG71_04510 [Candidatus Marinimicrobia bacterium]|nr:hypothetical protein [Candidatus Neomarinimicrobiota bacterium]|tara:strand:- start:5770 stop:6102 length:333 start_codon:yes stop_codon:yes gene_type:complete
MVAIITRDFQLGTRIADAVAASGGESYFPDMKERDKLLADLAVIDLDDASPDPIELIQQLISQNKDSVVVGCSFRVSKGLRDRAVAAGCSLVFTKSSLPKNISSVLGSIS